MSALSPREQKNTGKWNTQPFRQSLSIPVFNQGFCYIERSVFFPPCQSASENETSEFPTHQPKRDSFLFFCPIHTLL